MFNALIEVSDLQPLLGCADLAVIDCRFDLARPAWGADEFAKSHVPGAQYAHLDRDLAGPAAPTTGRHPLPAPEEFARRAAAWGIDSAVQVVAYDQGNGAMAARLWWLLRWLGHERVAVLNGGFAAWIAAGAPLEQTSSPRIPRVFEPHPHAAAVLGVGDVQQALARGEILLVDARAADRFAGRNETIDPVAGHVPGAVNHPFATNVGADGRFLDSDALRTRWQATLGGRAPHELVAMCGSGVTACHNLLALHVAGLPGARLYAGSWSEWIRDPARPVATGER